MRRQIDSTSDRRALRRMVPAAVVVLGVGLSGTAGAAQAPTPSQSDITFLQQASQSNKFEIATSEIAAQLQKKQSRSAAARDLATTANMIADAHRTAQTRLGALEKQLSLRVTQQPDPLQQFLVSQMASFTATAKTTVIGAGSKAGPSEGTNNGEGANGKAAPATDASAGLSLAGIRVFYLRMQVAAHQLAIARYTTAAKTTKDAPIRRFACQSLPMLETHLKAVEKALGSTSTATSSNSQTSTTGTSTSGNSNSSNSTGAGSSSALPRACSTP